VQVIKFCNFHVLLIIIHRAFIIAALALRGESPEDSTACEMILPQSPKSSMTPVALSELSPLSPGNFRNIMSTVTTDISGNELEMLEDFQAEMSESELYLSSAGELDQLIREMQADVDTLENEYNKLNESMTTNSTLSDNEDLLLIY
jgi:hypothetical protein